MKKSRIYPLRTASNSWKIKLYSKHICNDDCKLAYIEEQINESSSLMFIIDNPNYKDGKCSYSLTLNPSVARLHTFNKFNPQTIDGELLFESNIVIPDTKIFLHLEFPFKKPTNISIESENSLGFSLKDIIHTIKNVYKWVYKKEEETCSEKSHNIVSQCQCTKIDYSVKSQLCRTIIDKNDINNIDKSCPICLEEFTFEKEKLSITKCNHLFHPICLDKWTIDGNNNCPLCRDVLFVCNHCNGKEIICSEYIGKVIPKDMRGLIIPRNETDGIFGIYGCDFEDLYLEYMVYNSITKTLYPKIIT